MTCSWRLRIEDFNRLDGERQLRQADRNERVCDMQHFARVVSDGVVVPVIVGQDQLLDLRQLVPDITPDVIASGVLADVDRAPLEPVEGAVTYLAPLHRIRQVSATGFNYRKHIAEFNMTPPVEPEVFLKAVSSLCGPTDPISRGPNPGTKLDWETELAIVVGREARDISVDEAADYIFGYVCLNDVSDRATQVDEHGQQHLVRAKSRPTYPGFFARCCEFRGVDTRKCLSCKG